MRRAYPAPHNPILEIVIAAFVAMVAGFLMFGGIALVATWLGF